MNDMSQVIVPKSDQINADTLLAGPMTVTVRDVRINPTAEQPVQIELEETDLLYRPCKSMSRALVEVWGPDAKQYVGRSMTLYRDPSVTWGGIEVGGIRISHMSNMASKRVMQLTATKGKRKPHVVQPLEMAPKTDKVADGVAELLGRIRGAGTAAALQAIVEDPAVVKQRAWLKKNRPELAAQIDQALTSDEEDLLGTGSEQ